MAAKLHRLRQAITEVRAPRRVESRSRSGDGVEDDSGEEMGAGIRNVKWMK